MLHFVVFFGGGGVNRITSCKVSNTAYSCTTIWQLENMFIPTLPYMYSYWWHFKGRRYSDPRYNIWLYLISPHVVLWDRIQEKSKVNSKCAISVDTVPVIYYTNEYTKLNVSRNKRRKVYAINIHTIIFFEYTFKWRKNMKVKLQSI